ncbi:hypothetical protein [Porphyrobacter sp. AAP82]|uniref:hypothetical protein n=1 Tax=Porphyrobacter sp. AAP82 TaxID=1248917 RepID=UPI00036E5A5E|nr:hypothetical protein [Porphyrobacter sp. AAP82]
MEGRTETDAWLKALTIAFYALCDQLERKGAINQDLVADEMARYDPGDDDRLAANMQGIMASLRARPFALRGPTLDVIEGGKAD